MNNWGLFRFFKLSKIFVLLFTLVFSVGCTSFGKKLKALVGGGEQRNVPEAIVKPKVSFNQSPNYLAGPRRQYKRMTKQSLQDQSNLDASAGSLWVMEGQGAYLFSQNIMRMIGDPLAVRITGDPKAQLDAKVQVIKKLLNTLEKRRAARQRALASNKPADKPKEDGKKETAKAPAPGPGGKTAPSDGKDFEVKVVPTRVVERMQDGNYRVKGSQSFMIGSKEYKVIVAGIVRAEDFSDEGILASNLLDPRFDIVANRK